MTSVPPGADVQSFFYVAEFSLLVSVEDFCIAVHKEYFELFFTYDVFGFCIGG